MDEVLTVSEVASFLRTDNQTVTQLLESGELTGFRVNNDWRVLAPALIQFLGNRTQREQQRIVLRELSDPKSWARELRKDPQFESELGPRNSLTIQWARFCNVASLTWTRKTALTTLSTFAATTTSATEKSLDARGGSVFRKMIGPAMNSLKRAGASTQPFGSFAKLKGG